METSLGLCMDYMYGIVRNCLDSMYGFSRMNRWTGRSSGWMQ